MKHLTHVLIYSPAAMIIWNDLRDQFNMIDGARIFHLNRELYETRQGDSSVVDYFSTIKMIWDELFVVDDDSLCTDCFVSPRVVASKDMHSLIQFLIWFK